MNRGQGWHTPTNSRHSADINVRCCAVPDQRQHDATWLVNGGRQHYMARGGSTDASFIKCVFFSIFVFTSILSCTNKVQEILFFYNNTYNELPGNVRPQNLVCAWIMSATDSIGFSFFNIFVWIQRCCFLFGLIKGCFQLNYIFGTYCFVFYLLFK